MFEDIDRLVAYFQDHIDDSSDSTPSLRSVAAMLPVRSPATGGSSGSGGGWGNSSNDGGWRGGQSSDRHRNSGPRMRGDYRNGDGHPSGAPRPYGGGGRVRGRGRRSDSYGNGRGDRQYHDRGSQRWGSKDGNGDGGWGSGFSGSKAQDSPGGGSWGGGVGGNAGWGSWGGDAWGFGCGCSQVIYAKGAVYLLLHSSTRAMTTSRQRTLIIHDAPKQLSISLRSIVVQLSLRYGSIIKLLVITEALWRNIDFMLRDMASC
ncbi:transcription elongation factor SPT6 homolog [Salvia hispanica]|uniref:transcription elongation factor SPT6 homolog n=1 Tax=Salvia hispanica TaxID=49212 RepID=UPI0020091997|nr:transcription elongation factor SPT6 homolog [Salvia hispanica]